MPSRSSSTACRNETPSVRITQSMTLPPVWHSPRQCHRFLAGDTTSEGLRSSWKGHRPARSAPALRSSTPRACTRETSDTSVFSRSISASGTLATLPPGKTLPD